METTFISAAVQNIWNAWNIRGFMIISLCMQLLLALAAPFRKKTSNGFFILVVWSTYLLADWAAIFAFGLISNAGCRNSKKNEAEVPQDVMAFWAAFLLVHLGGPDTITAFSLEDNALWLRHLVGLIAQLFAFMYIFVKTLPGNKLLVPTILIFVTGVVKYGERTRALYLASLENMMKSIKKTLDIDDDINSDGNEENDGAHFPKHIRPAFHFHKIFKGLIVDITPDLSEWIESRRFISRKDPNEVFGLISTELNFLYEVFYTKIMAANSGWGVFIRCIAHFSTLATFILFCLADKDEFRGVDVAITYALLAGYYAVDLASAVMLIMSDWAKTNGMKYVLITAVVQGFILFLVGYLAKTFFFQHSAVGCLFDRLWPEKMDLFNLLSHCFKECAPRKCRNPGFLWERLAEMRNTSREVFDHELWKLIFADVETKAMPATDAERMTRVYEARGNWAIEGGGWHELKYYIHNLQYDNTLLMWHVATEICYNLDEDVDGGNGMKRFSKILSDYMMYLLVMQPKLMSAVAGIGHIRYEHTCFEAKLLGKRKFGVPTLREFCKLILEEHLNITEPDDIQRKHYENSVLNDACKLVRLLRENNYMWEIILKVWMEMLEYAACHCKASSHARQLSQGGEFITFVWMLMTHWGVGAQFPINWKHKEK